MRALRVLGLAEDGAHLVCEQPESEEKFAVPVDERLRAAARGDLSRFGQLEIEMEPQLRPREIQARIRAGASVEQVAAAAGCSASRIERYAYPVLLERSSITERARRARPVSGMPSANRSVQDVVADALADRGQRQEVSWDAFREKDAWVLVLRWRAGRSENRAHWTFHPGPDGGTLTARDAAAAEIVDPSPRPLRTIRSDTATRSSALADPEPGPDRHLITEREAPPVPDDIAIDVAAAGRPHEGEVERREADPPAIQQGAQQAAAPAQARAEMARTGTDHPSSKAARRGQRAPMPSWEDVLLGTRSSGR